jgi:uncharacterized membrane protein
MVAVVGQIALYFNIDITKYVGQDYKGLLYLVFTMLGLMGITVDTSSKGFSDIVPNNDTEEQTETTNADTQQQSELLDVVKLQKIKDILNN